MLFTKHLEALVIKWKIDNPNNSFFYCPPSTTSRSDKPIQIKGTDNVSEEKPGRIYQNFAIRLVTNDDYFNDDMK